MCLCILLNENLNNEKPNTQGFASAVIYTDRDTLWVLRKRVFKQVIWIFFTILVEKSVILILLNMQSFL